MEVLSLINSKPCYKESIRPFTFIIVCTPFRLFILCLLGLQTVLFLGHQKQTTNQRSTFLTQSLNGKYTKSIYKIQPIFIFMIHSTIHGWYKLQTQN